MYAYLTKRSFFRLNSSQWQWRWKYGKKVNIKENTNYHLTEFHFFDQHEEEIKL